MFTKIVAGITPIVLALAAMTFAPTSALAYQGCQGNSTITESSTTAPGGGSITITVTIKDCSGNPVPGQTVDFTQIVGPANCHLTFNPTSAITDANGQASTTVTFPNNCPGNYTVNAGAAGVSFTVQLVESGGLPAAGASAPAPPANPGLPLWLAVAGLLILAGGGTLVLRRLRA